MRLLTAQGTVSSGVAAKDVIEVLRQEDHDVTIMLDESIHSSHDWLEYLLRVVSELHKAKKANEYLTCVTRTCFDRYELEIKMRSSE